MARTVAVGCAGSDGEVDRIETAVHEALTNALLHGCLEVDGFSRSSADSLLEQSARIAARADDPAYATRRIRLSVVPADGGHIVVVGDDGPGFDPDAIGNGAGRGITILTRLADAVAYSTVGNVVRLTFRTPAPPVAPGPA